MEIKQIPQMDEYRLLVDEKHPILLRYDMAKEQVVILAVLDIEQCKNQKAVYRRLLQAGPNPLRGHGPGVGIDDKSGVCFSYMKLPRQTVNADQICFEIGKLVQWGKQVGV